MHEDSASYDEQATEDVRELYRAGSSFEDVLHRDLLNAARSVAFGALVEPKLRRQIVNELVDLYLDYRLLPGSISVDSDGSISGGLFVGPGGYSGLRLEIEAIFKDGRCQPEWKADVLSRLYSHIAKGYPVKKEKPIKGLRNRISDFLVHNRFDFLDYYRSSDNAIAALVLLDFKNLGSEFATPLVFAIQGLGSSRGFAPSAVARLNETPPWSPEFLAQCRPAIEAFGQLAQKDSKALTALKGTLPKAKENVIHALGNAAKVNPEAARILLEFLPTLQMGEVKAQLLEVIQGIKPENDQVLAVFREYKAVKDIHVKQVAVGGMARPKSQEDLLISSNELLKDVTVRADFTVRESAIRELVMIGSHQPDVLEKLLDKIQNDAYEQWELIFQGERWKFSEIIDHIINNLDEAGDISDKALTDLEKSYNIDLSNVPYMASEVAYRRREDLKNIYYKTVNLLEYPENIAPQFLALLYLSQMQESQSASRFFSQATYEERTADYWLIEKVKKALKNDRAAMAVLSDLTEAKGVDESFDQLRARRSAMHWLSQTNDPIHPDSMPIILKNLGDEDEEIHQFAVKALGKVCESESSALHPQAVRLLLGLIDDENSKYSTDRLVFETIKEANEPSQAIIPFLISVVKDEISVVKDQEQIEDVRRLAFTLLNKVRKPDEAVLGLMLETVKQRKSVFYRGRCIALETLRNCDQVNEHILNTLLIALEDQDLEVCASAAQTLKDLADRAPQVGLDQKQLHRAARALYRTLRDRQKTFAEIQKPILSDRPIAPDAIWEALSAVVEKLNI